MLLKTHPEDTLVMFGDLIHREKCRCYDEAVFQATAAAREIATEVTESKETTWQKKIRELQVWVAVLTMVNVCAITCVVLVWISTSCNDTVSENQLREETIRILNKCHDNQCKKNKTSISANITSINTTVNDGGDTFTSTLPVKKYKYKIENYNQTKIHDKPQNIDRPENFVKKLEQNNGNNSTLQLQKDQDEIEKHTLKRPKSSAYKSVESDGNTVDIERDQAGINKPNLNYLYDKTNKDRPEQVNSLIKLYAYESFPASSSKGPDFSDGKNTRSKDDFLDKGTHGFSGINTDKDAADNSLTDTLEDTYVYQKPDASTYSNGYTDNFPFITLAIDYCASILDFVINCLGYTVAKCFIIIFTSLLKFIINMIVYIMRIIVHYFSYLVSFCCVVGLCRFGYTRLISYYYKNMTRKLVLRYGHRNQRPGRKTLSDVRYVLNIRRM